MIQDCVFAGLGDFAMNMTAATRMALLFLTYNPEKGMNTPRQVCIHPRILLHDENLRV
jgi:hypothetical protein